MKGAKTPLTPIVNSLRSIEMKLEMMYTQMKLSSTVGNIVGIAKGVLSKIPKPKVPDFIKNNKMVKGFTSLFSRKKKEVVENTPNKVEVEKKEAVAEIKPAEVPLPPPTPEVKPAEVQKEAPKEAAKAPEDKATVVNAPKKVSWNGGLVDAELLAKAREKYDEDFLKKHPLALYQEKYAEISMRAMAWRKAKSELRVQKRKMVAEILAAQNAQTNAAQTTEENVKNISSDVNNSIKADSVDAKTIDASSVKNEASNVAVDSMSANAVNSTSLVNQQNSTETAVAEYKQSQIESKEKASEGGADDSSRNLQAIITNGIAGYFDSKKFKVDGLDKEDATVEFTNEDKIDMTKEYDTWQNLNQA